MDKQNLKSAVVSLKPAIKQAKVHVIHKLSRQVNQIKTKKTQNDAQKEKNIKKSERFATEIKALRDVGENELAKFLLQNERTFDEVKESPGSLLPNSTVDLKQRAFVRIADFGKVKTLVTEFRSKLPKVEQVSRLIKITDNQKQKKRIAKKKNQLKKKLQGKDKKAKNSKDDNNDKDVLGLNGEEADTEEDSDSDDDEQDSTENDEQGENDRTKLPKTKLPKVDHQKQKRRAARKKNLLKKKLEGINKKEKKTTFVLGSNGEEADTEEDNDEQDSTDNDEQDSTDNDEQDSTVNDEQDSTVNDEQDSTDNFEQDITDNDEQDITDNDEEGGTKASSDEDEKEFRDYDESEASDEDANYGGDGDLTDSENESEKAFVTSLRTAISSTNEVEIEPQEGSRKKDSRKNIDKNEGEVLIKVLNLKDKKDDSDSEESDDADNSSKSESDADINPKIHTDELSSKKKTVKAKSSFFLGGKSDSEEDNEDGEDEEESAPFGEDVIQKRKESLKLKFEKNVKDDRGFRGTGRGQRGRGDFGGRGGNRGSFRGRGSDFRGRGSDFRGRGSDFRGRGRGKSFEVNSSVQTLHPSWAAKRKVNPSMVEFQGKKTKFSDDVAAPPPKSNPGPAAAVKTSATSEKLHPSWAAKQSIQKPVIQSFQGKKITFD